MQTPNLSFASPPKLSQSFIDSRVPSCVNINSFDDFLNISTAQIAPSTPLTNFELPPLPPTTCNRKAYHIKLKSSCSSSSSSSSSVSSPSTHLNKKSKSEILTAIEFERKKYEVSKLKLQTLHDSYNKKLTDFKYEIQILKKKLSILVEYPARDNLEWILERKEKIYNDHIKRRAAMSEEQIKCHTLAQQNQKLQITIHHLGMQLNDLLKKHPQFYQHQNDENTNVGKPDPAGIMEQNPEFSKIIQENRRYERQIKFLNHIIEKEKQRSIFQQSLFDEEC